MTPNRHLTRRQFARVSTFGATSFSLSSLAESRTPVLQSQLLLEMELQLAEVELLDPRQITAVTGGRFHGPRLKGVALKGGGDWVITRPDGTSELNLRTTLQTSDHDLINVWARGVIQTTEDSMMLSRTTPVFETTSAQYGWLNQLIAVGVGYRTRGKAQYRIYEIT